IGNTGDINTGAFISGNMNNGLFWRGDRNGLIGGELGLAIPALPLTLSGSAALELPITGDITGLSVNPFSIHGLFGDSIPLDLTLIGDGDTDGFDLVFDLGTISIPIGIDTIRISLGSFTIPISGLPITLSVPMESEMDPIRFPAISLGRIPVDLSLGASTLDVDIDATVGPIVVSLFQALPQPGFGNMTLLPSSGFFNIGDGGSSGFGNIGSALSGLWNIGSQISGFENYGGSLLSGLTNLGSVISGIGNTSTLGLALASYISGIGNVGKQLSGIGIAGSVP
ncbi:hypothetical protein, partial [Mycobacterium bourgelatii]